MKYLLWYEYAFGILVIASPLIVLLVYWGIREGWNQYWSGGDEGPW